MSSFNRSEHSSGNSLVRFFMENPISSIVLMMLWSIVTFIASRDLELRKYPKSEKVGILIEVQHPGVDSKTIEAQVTSIVEGAMSTIRGVSVVASQIQNGISRTQVEFHEDISSDTAIMKVSNQLSAIKRKLPRNIEEPIIYPYSGSDKPCMTIMASCDESQELVIKDVLERNIKPIFLQYGAAKVEIVGAGDMKLVAKTNQDKMAKYGITAQDIETALRSHESINRASGRIVSDSRDVMTKLDDSDDLVTSISNVRVKTINTEYIKLGDVADIRIGDVENRSLSLFDGKGTLVIYIYCPSSESPVILCSKIKENLEDLQQKVPNSKLTIYQDDSQDIKKSIRGVYKALIEAIILVAIVVFMFLGSIRAASIPIVALILSMFAGVVAIKLWFSLNLVTAFAFILASGIVIDDAIVVMENIIRISSKFNSFEAALLGTTEMFSAVITMTLTLVAVYAPIIFMTGDIARQFREFAVVLIVCVIASGIVSIIFTPLMCLKLLGNYNHNNFVENLLAKIEQKYKQSLEWAINNSKSIMKTAIIACGVIYLSGMILLPSEHRPTEDSNMIKVYCNAASDSSTKSLSEQMKKLSTALQEVPEVKHHLLTCDASRIICNVVLRNDRKQTSKEIAKNIKAKLEKLVPTLETRIEDSDNQEIVEFFIQSIDPDINKLNDAFSIITSAIRSDPAGQMIVGITKVVSPKVAYNQLIFDSEELAEFAKMDPHEISASIGPAVMPVKVFYLPYQDKIIPIVVASSKNKSIEDIMSLYTRMPMSQRTRQNDGYVDMIKIGDVVKVKPRSAVTSHQRYQQMASAQVYCMVLPGYGIEKAVDLILRAKKKLPAGTTIEFSGRTREFIESKGKVISMVLMALLLIYLFLAAQFENWTSAFIVLATVPWGLSGNFIGLLLLRSKGSLSVYSYLAIVTTFGLIVKNGILLVAAANRILERDRCSAKEAVIAGAAQRFRPISMTSIAMTIGSVPLALASDSIMKQQIGMVIGFGMIAGSIFTMWALPLFYIYIKDMRENIRQKIIDLLNWIKISIKTTE